MKKKIQLPNIHTGQTLDLFEIRFDQIEWKGRIHLSLRRMVCALEVEFGPRMITTFHLASAAYLLGSQDIIPTARISVHREGTGFAKATTDPKFTILD